MTRIYFSMVLGVLKLALQGDSEGEDEEASEGDVDDNASFASVDDLEEEAAAHKLELKKLAEQDPEFFKYLQENDRELLAFDAGEDEDMDEDMDIAEGGEEDEEMKAPTLTSGILKRWQKAILEVSRNGSTLLLLSAQ